MLHVIAQFESPVRPWGKLSGPAECGPPRPKRLVMLVAATVPATVELLEQIRPQYGVEPPTGQMHSSVLTGKEGQRPFTRRWEE